MSKYNHSTRKTRSAKNSAFVKQESHCFYCGVQMWLKDNKQYIAEFGLTKREAMRFQCTAEHLVARCDGGSDAPDNVVAACKFCNQTRHRRKCPPTHHAYKEYVCNRLAMGRWHSRRYVSLLSKHT